MMRLRVTIVLSMAALACGEREKPIPELVPVSESGRAIPERAAPARLAIYDQHGNLKVSNVKVAGLPLPVGATLVGEQGRWHSYDSEAPIDKLKSFFSTQLDTMSLLERGPGVVFERAQLKRGGTGAARLTVSLMPAGRDRSRIEIREIPVPRIVDQKLSPQEAIRLLEERQRNLD